MGGLVTFLTEWHGGSQHVDGLLYIILIGCALIVVSGFVYLLVEKIRGRL